MAGRREVVCRVIGSIHRRTKMTSGKIPSHFAELLDSLPDVLAWVKDRQGRYLWVNRAFLIQYSLDHPGGKEFAAVESIQGKTDYDLSPAFLADQFRHDDEQVLAGHRIVNRLERVGESQGTTVWNITDKIPVVDAKGAIIGALPGLLAPPDPRAASKQPPPASDRPWLTCAPISITRSPIGSSGRRYRVRRFQHQPSRSQLLQQHADAWAGDG